MKHTSRIWPILAVCAAAYAMPQLAGAQRPVATAPPPPQTQPLEEGEAPAVTIRRPGAGEEPITQKKQQGKVTEVKVQSGGSTYYLKPNEQSGSALPGDVESKPMRGSQWQVLEFDMKPQKDQKPVEQAPDAPQPAPASAPTK
jgi:hypothetical protein